MQMDGCFQRFPALPSGPDEYVSRDCFLGFHQNFMCKHRSKKKKKNEEKEEASVLSLYINKETFCNNTRLIASIEI